MVSVGSNEFDISTGYQDGVTPVHTGTVRITITKKYANP